MVFIRRRGICGSFWNPEPTYLFNEAGTDDVNENYTGSKVQDAESEHHQAPALGGAVQGKEKSVPRIIVRFTGYRVRPLDPDNFAGGCKDLLDALRNSGLIHGDEPWRIIFETAQEKVKTYAEERTVIELEYP